MAGGRFSLQAIFKARDRFSRPISKMSRGVARFTRKAEAGFRRMSRAADRVSAGFKRVGLAAVAMGAAAGAALLNIGKTGASFEQAITNVGAVSLKTRDQIQPLEEQAKSLGATTKFTATQVAEGMEIMARAGFNTEQIMAGVPGVLDAAAASGLELAEVSNVVSNVLKGMGKDASEASDVADILALASARTNSTIGSLGESMKNVASTARQLDIPLKDTVAAVASLQDVGLDASVAGSALNTMLTKLAAPSDSLRRKFKKLGIAFETDGGKALPFAKIIENLSVGAKKAGGNMKQVAFLSELVGLRGQKAAANLAKLFEAGKLEELTTELEGAKGAAGKMAKIRMSTVTGDLLKLEAATDAVKIALFETQGAPLRGVIQGMTKWVDANKDLIKTKLVQFIDKVDRNQDRIIDGMKAIGIGLAAWVAFTIAIKATALAIGIYRIAATAASVTTTVLTTALGLAKTVTLLLVGAVRSETAATIASSVAQRAKAIALGIAQVATTRFTVVELASTVATKAKTVAVNAQLVARRAWNAVVAISAAIQSALTVNTVRETAAIVANVIATKAKNVAMALGNARTAVATTVTLAWATATGTATAAQGGAAVAAGSLNAALAPLLVTLLAIGAAVGAAIVAFQQFKQLQSELGATSISQFASDVASEGFGGAFSKLDERENQLARQEAAERQAQVVTPSERTSRAITETTSTQKSEVTIVDKTGQAKVTKQPKGAGKIRLQQSGAFE